MKRPFVSAFAALIVWFSICTANSSGMSNDVCNSAIDIKVINPGKVLVVGRCRAEESDPALHYELMTTKTGKDVTAKMRQAGYFQTELKRRGELCRATIGLGGEDRLDVTLKIFQNDAVIAEEYAVITGAEVVQ